MTLNLTTNCGLIIRIFCWHAPNCLASTTQASACAGGWSSVELVSWRKLQSTLWHAVQLDCKFLPDFEGDQASVKTLHSELEHACGWRVPAMA